MCNTLNLHIHIFGSLCAYVCVTFLYMSEYFTCLPEYAYTLFQKMWCRTFISCKLIFKKFFYSWKQQ